MKLTAVTDIDIVQAVSPTQLQALEALQAAARHLCDIRDSMGPTKVDLWPGLLLEITGHGRNGMLCSNDKHYSLVTATS